MSRDAYFIVEIPKSKTDDFLARAVVPAMEAIRDECGLDDWSFDALEIAALPEGICTFRFHLILPDAGGSILRERAAEAWSHLPEVVVRTVPTPPVPNRERFGGDRGLRIQSRFRGLDSRLAIAVLAKSAPPIARKRIALTSIFFFLDAIGIPTEKRAHWLTLWAGKLLTAEANTEWDKRLATARNTHRESSAVNELVAALAAGDRGAFTDTYAMYREPYRELLASLERTDYAGSDRFPPYFAAWQSYLHLHLLRIGVDNELECGLLLLAASHYLEMNDRS